MSSVSVRVVVILSLLLLVALVAMKHFYGRTLQADEKIMQLELDITAQQRALQEQAVLLEDFNQLARETQHRAAAKEAQLQANLSQFREQLKGEKICDSLVPAAVAERLYGYTHRLRTDALSATSSGVDRTDYRAATTTSLTYCQAVLWIDPLLTAIERANDQLSALRASEKLRQSSAAQH